MLSLALFVLLSAEPASLAAAKQHLAQGKLDDVLFDLQGQKFENPNQAKAAADVLAQTAARSFQANDDLMALQLSQMALSHDKAHPTANETAARASLRQQQFEDAERYGDAWLAVTKSSAARLFRAQLALDQAEWQRAAKLIDEGSFEGAELERASRIRDTAKSELESQRGAMSEVKALEAAMEKAAADARKLQPVAVARSGEVIVYSAVWCGYCTRVKSWLAQRKVAFIEKDIEKDPAAAPELASKIAAAKLRPEGGVPWTDVRGTLVRGYDPKRLEEALRSGAGRH